MTNQIVVQKRGQRREYYPVTDVPLSETSIEHLEHRPFLRDWEPENLDEMDELEAALSEVEGDNETSEEAEQAEKPKPRRRRRHTFGLSHPEDIGSRGEQLIRGIAVISGIEEAWVKPDEVSIDLRPGFKWSDVEPQVLNVITQALGWEGDVELLEYNTWYATLEGGKQEERSALSRLMGTEEDEEQPQEAGEAGIVVQRGQSYRSGAPALSYWPPCRIAEESGYFSGDVEKFDDEDKETFDKVGDQAQQLVRQLLHIEGVVQVSIDTFNLTVTVSPAFDRLAIHRKVLDLLKATYQLG